MFINLQNHIIAVDTIKQIYPYLARDIALEFKDGDRRVFEYKSEEDRDRIFRYIKEALFD